MTKHITLLNILIISCFLVIIACETKEQKRQKVLNEIVEWKASNPDWNKPKLYAPKYQDRFWRSHEPYLTGAEGWIIEECSYQPKDEHNVGRGKWIIIEKEWWGKRIKVITQRLGHKGWGEYEGLLYVEIIDIGKKINLDYSCFKPDYEVGEWIGIP